MGCGAKPAGGRHQLEGSASHPDHRPNVGEVPVAEPRIAHSRCESEWAHQ
jgi:hypothetical protein